MSLDPDTKVLRDDLRWIPASDVIAGDRLIGFRWPGERTWRTVLVNETRQLPSRTVVSCALDNGTVLRLTENQELLCIVPYFSTKWVAAKSLQHELNVGTQLNTPIRIQPLMKVWADRIPSDRLGGIRDGSTFSHSDLKITHTNRGQFIRLVNYAKARNIRFATDFKGGATSDSSFRPLGDGGDEGLVAAMLDFLSRTNSHRYFQFDASLLGGISFLIAGQRLSLGPIITEVTTDIRDVIRLDVGSVEAYLIEGFGTQDM